VVSTCGLYALEKPTVNYMQRFTLSGQKLKTEKYDTTDLLRRILTNLVLMVSNLGKVNYD
jgi:hypothetical protein